MYTDEEIARKLQEALDRYGLSEKGWIFEFSDSYKGFAGFTHQETKTIELSMACWPTADENIDELIRHEVAHALCGHGLHNIEWWDKLVEIGGHGIWIADDGDLIEVLVID